jgi:hypothetical protein
MKRRLTLLLLLAGCSCDVDRVNATNGAREVARDTLRACVKVCPAGSTPMVVSTPRDVSVSWSCGCLAARPVEAL